MYFFSLYCTRNIIAILFISCYRLIAYFLKVYNGLCFRCCVLLYRENPPRSSQNLEIIKHVNEIYLYFPYKYIRKLEDFPTPGISRQLVSRAKIAIAAREIAVVRKRRNRETK